MGRIFDQKALRARRELFSIAPLQILTNSSLTPTARLVLVYGLGKPDDWVHTFDSLSQALGLHRETVRKALSELEAAHYAVRRVWREGQRNRSDVTFVYPSSLHSDNPDPTDPVLQTLTDRSCSTDSDGQTLTDRSCSTDPVVQTLTVREPPVLIEEEQGRKTREEEQVRVTKEESKDLSSAQRSAEPTTTPTVDAPRQSKSIAGRSSIVLLDDDDPEAVDDAPPSVAKKTRKPRASGDLDFDRFWTAYGMRGTKRQAMDQWKKAIKRADVEDIIGAAERYAASTPDLQYRKHAERWLRDDCWTSLVVTPTNGHTNGHVAFKDAGTDVWAAAKAKLRNGSLSNSNG